MKVIIVAYNQFELLQMEIEALRLLAGIEERDLIIVDNGSEDGLRQWLEERLGMNYLICDEGKLQCDCKLCKGRISDSGGHIAA